MSDSPEHISNLFIAYLRDNKTDAKHVFRVASWIGMLALAVDRVKQSWHRPTPRQLFFDADTGGRVDRFKIRYAHPPKAPRGGFEIVEVAMSRGHPEIGPVAVLGSLADVEQFYRLCNMPGWDFAMVLAAYHGSASARSISNAQTHAAVTP